MRARIVFACSGSPRSVATLSALAADRGAEVIALVLDLGQGQELEEARDRALEAGASRAHVMDVRDEYARDFVLPALHAGVPQVGAWPVAIQLAQPLIGRKLVDVAAIEEAAAVAHDCDGPERIQIENTVRALNPDLRVIGPSGVRRTPATRATLWARVIEYAGPEAPPESVYAWTRSPAAAPDERAEVEIAFEGGVPIAISGVSMDLTELIESVSTIAGRHGVGRMRAPGGGERSQGPCWMQEAPAAAVLHAAHAALETAVCPIEMRQVKTRLGRAYAELLSNGHWFAPLREAVDAFTAVVQRQVRGVVRLRMHKSQLVVLDSRPSPMADESHPVAPPLRPIHVAVRRP